MTPNPRPQLRGPLTVDELDALEALAAAATPGPYEVETASGGSLVRAADRTILADYSIESEPDMPGTAGVRATGPSPAAALLSLAEALRGRT